MFVLSYTDLDLTYKTFVTIYHFLVLPPLQKLQLTIFEITYLISVFLNFFIEAELSQVPISIQHFNCIFGLKLYKINYVDIIKSFSDIFSSSIRYL